MTTAPSSKSHHGRNLKRIREMLGVKQDALASEMGGDWNQRKISLLEQKESIDDSLLEELAKALRVTPEAIKNFNVDAAINIVATTFNSHDNSTSIAYQSTLNFNPLDKYVNEVEENKRLYEALLKSEREKIALLEKMLETKNQ